MKAKEYRKKPVVIEAVQWTGENMGEILGFFGGAALREGQDIIIGTLEGEMRATPGDWIIKGVKGEFYPIKSEIFAQTYEARIMAALDVQPLTVQDAARVPEIASLIEAAKGLNRIVEEIYGTMAHGCWLDTHGKRLKDTSEWVALYVALVAALRAIAEGR